jgi:hypothetical protein
MHGTPTPTLKQGETVITTTVSCNQCGRVIARDAAAIHIPGAGIDFFNHSDKILETIDDIEDGYAPIKGDANLSNVQFCSGHCLHLHVETIIKELEWQSSTQ